MRPIIKVYSAPAEASSSRIMGEDKVECKESRLGLLWRFLRDEFVVIAKAVFHRMYLLKLFASMCKKLWKNLKITKRDARGL